MDYTAKYITEDIKLSSYQDHFFKSDMVFDQHMLVWFISGETKIIQSANSHTFKTGDIFLIPRNQLATIINYPTHGKPHQTVVMHLTTERLKQFYENVAVTETGISSVDVLSYSGHPLLQSCMASLIPYFDMDELPEQLASLKIAEAITILRSIDPKIDGVLANFEAPGKIDLVTFMGKNFIFNIPLERFGYLTGRSLTTFKRDFKKYFNTTPQRWLTQKRLELAHYRIGQSQQKPIDVCYEVGFENLSHFSYAFKKQFGYAPSQLLK